MYQPFKFREILSEYEPKSGKLTQGQDLKIYQNN